MPSQSKLLGDLISSAGVISITSGVANTAITGTITGSQISSNTLSNTVFQTGSVENYLSAQGLGFAFRNRIINGAMVIDQRNAGASVSASSANAVTYTLDRWFYYATQASKFTIQQNAASVTPPVGFVNYLGVTSSSAYSVGSGDLFIISQRIEGLNISDLAWGTANAQTVTLSFRVYSSLTGTFGGSVKNSAGNRSYPFTYTISSANTWETKTVTIAGDTTGTWLTTNGIGIDLNFGLGVGSSTSAAAGAWAAGNYVSATGATSVVGTNGATFYITGVQLEKGSTATSFDYRPHGTELQLCQRYYQTLPFDAGYVSVAATINTSAARGPLFQLNQNMRVAPTVTLPTAGSGAGQLHYTNSSGAVPATIGTNSVLGTQVNSFRVEGDGYTSAFTAGQAVMLRVGTGAGASIIASAEL